ncbi:MAG: pyridoxamine 5'-phosphate oxidase family protein [Thaumarchaeota archaeon]|nr:pyridoxamine 5'-phosphate oxidase family protein [Nitrososphaerota archaeon]
MPQMSEQQIEEFLRESRVTRIATVTEDGAPYVVPVVYEWDGKQMYLVARKRAAWVRYIRREPRVCVVTDEEPLPQRKVIVEGIAEIMDTDWVEIARRIVTRYLGPSVSEKYLQGTLDQPRLVIRITPKKITTWHNPPQLADRRQSWHHRYYEPGSRWYEEYQRETSGRG